MKQNIIKALLFIVTFIISLIVISAILNSKNTDMTADMSSAVLPIVKVQIDGNTINTLHGYTGDMDARYLRDTLTPIGSQRKLTMKISQYGNKIIGMNYEVRSLDTSRLVEKTDVYDFINEKEETTAVFEFKDLIDTGVEYLLITSLQMNVGPDVKYYTRIVSDDTLPVASQISFVKDFHEKTFDKKEAKSLTTYLESNESGDNSSYAHVNIHSSFNQVTWGDLNIDSELYRSINIYELNKDLSSIGISYIIKIKNNKEDEYYQVHEFYRTRYTEERIYLLDYERTMEQIFDPSNDVFVNDKIMLGITDEEHEIYETTDGNVVLFKQFNSLYEYRINEGKLARIFSFYDDKNFDERTTYDEHKIKVLNVDETGNVLYMVYGYMNRGVHEGKVGVSVEYYNNALNCIEEQVYIPYDKSFGILSKELEKLTYQNFKNELYVYLGNNVYCIRLDGGDGQILVQGLTIDRLVASKSNQLIAWDDNNSGKITMMDLSNGNIRDIVTDSNEGIVALGFLGSDIVYGKYNKNDIVKDATGLSINPMYKIVVEDRNGKLLKEYEQAGIYVTQVSFSDTTAQLTRIKIDNGHYTKIDNDQIIHNEEVQTTRNTITEVVTQDRETVTEIALISNVTKSIHMQTPKFVLTEGIKNFNLKENEEEHKRYYVYANGHLQGIYTQTVKGVMAAAAENGVVLNDNQMYLWQKGNRKQRCEIKGIELGKSINEELNRTSLCQCLDAVLSYEDSPKNSSYELNNGETAISLLRKNITGEIMQLTGCQLSDILYYVSQDTPVLAVANDRNMVLIVGYDEKNIIILDPLTGGRYKKGMNDSTEMFTANGNEFIAYVK